MPQGSYHLTIPDGIRVIDQEGEGMALDRSLSVTTVANTFFHTPWQGGERGILQDPKSDTLRFGMSPSQE